eukprot:TRINITY_DN3690_c1_g1_i1.p1 TRINITY_DN3690_c1_g1~~TRINITY_DN3690_c1_g1_i1.p1  ORF type:complete len:1709 (+),score=512.43 TRINITY_DN3690_c1_g1_i1:549-5129(+)
MAGGGDGAGAAKMLLVAVSYSDDPALFLPGAAQETRAVQQLLTRRCFLPPQRRVLAEGSGTPPTRDNVMTALRWLVRGAVAGDSLFVHVVARGVRSLPELGHDPGEGEALAPCDWREAGLIRDDELWDVLVGGLGTGVRLTCVFDVFSAGPMLELPFRLTATRDGTITLTEGSAEPVPGQVISASLAPDADSSCPAGALTNAFVAALVSRPRPSHEQLAADLRTVLMQRLGERAPGAMVASSQRFDLRAPFSMQAVRPEGPVGPQTDPEHQALVRRIEQLEDEVERQRKGQPAAAKKQSRGRRAERLQPADELLGAARAVIVGVGYDDAPERARLEGSADKARAVQRFLMEQGFNSRLRVLTEDAQAEHLRPTRDNVLAAMRWLSRSAEAGEALYFHFIGHGAAAASGGNGTAVALAPSDFARRGYITGDEIASVMVRALPPGCRLTCIADMAAAGTIAELPHVMTAQGSGLSFSHSPLDAGEVPASVLILGTVPGEADAADGQRTPGALTHALTTVLSLTPQPTLSELLRGVGEQLKQQLGEGCRMPRVSASWRASASEFFHLGIQPQQLKVRRNADPPSDRLSPARAADDGGVAGAAAPAEDTDKTAAGSYDGGAAFVSLSQDGKTATVTKGALWGDSAKTAAVHGADLKFADDSVGSATYDADARSLTFPQLGTDGKPVVWTKDKAKRRQSGAAHATVASYPNPPPRPSPVVVGASRAVTIGIDYRGQGCQLNGCVRDTRTWQRFLQRQCFHAELRCLTDDNPSYMPTRANIMACLRWLVRECMPGDCLLLHYCGHGTRHAGVDPSGPPSAEHPPGICPVDWESAGMIGGQELMDTLATRLPAGARLTCVFDLDAPCPTPVVDVPTSLTVTQDGGFELRERAEPPLPAHVVSITAAPPPPPHPAAGSAGSLTTAFMTVLNHTPQPTHEALLRGLASAMRQRGGEEAAAPRVSSSRRLSPAAPFFLGAAADPALLPPGSASAPPPPPPLTELSTPSQGADPGQQQTITGATKALIIGVTYQGQEVQLPQAGSAARSMASMLQRAGFRGVTKLLLDDDPQSVPTRANIAQAISWLLTGVDPGDSLFFSFAGHGPRMAEQQEGGVVPACIAPSDWASAGTIDLSELRDALVDPLVPGARLTAIIDVANPTSTVDLQHWLTAEADGGFALTQGRRGRQTEGSAVFISALTDPRQPPPHPGGGGGVGALSTSIASALERHEQPTCSQLLSDVRQGMGQRTGVWSLVPRISSSRPFAPGDRFHFGALPQSASTPLAVTSPPPQHTSDWARLASPPPAAWRGPSAVRDDGVVVDASPRRQFAQRAPADHDGGRSAFPEYTPIYNTPARQQQQARVQPYRLATEQPGGQGYYDPTKMAQLSSCMRDIQQSISDALAEARERNEPGSRQRGTLEPLESMRTAAPRPAALQSQSSASPLRAALPAGAAPRKAALRTPTEPLGMRLVPGPGGMAVEAVTAGSPAHLAGVGVGDIVHTIGGFPVLSTDDVRAARALASRQGSTAVFMDVTPALLA